MSVIELLWHLNVTEKTKYLIIIGFIVCIMLLCIYNGKKKTVKNKKIKNNKIYKEYYNKLKPTNCQTKYMQCVQNNIINEKNEFCYPCLENGNSPDFFYNPQLNEWIQMEQ
jgi:hypothetical protein